MVSRLGVLAKERSRDRSSEIRIDVLMNSTIGSWRTFPKETILMRYPDGLTWNESATSLFQPDQLLWLQFFATFQRKILEPERELMLAVLEDAIACIAMDGSCSGGKGKRLFLDALDWIVKKDEQWPFSFNNICAALHLDSEYLRAGLLRLANQESNSLNASLRKSPGPTMLKRRVVRVSSPRGSVSTRRPRFY